MRFSLFPLIVILMPILEIAGFIVVGKTIGLWLTLALILLTSMAGLLILRSGGLGMLRKVSAANQTGAPPAADLIQGAMLVIAGILLFLPGFITDIIGLMLLIPFVRRALWAAFGARIAVAGSFSRSRSGPAPNGNRSADPKVVDLDEEDFHREGSDKSPWYKKKNPGDLPHP